MIRHMDWNLWVISVDKRWGMDKNLLVISVVTTEPNQSRKSLDFWGWMCLNCFLFCSWNLDSNSQDSLFSSFSQYNDKYSTTFDYKRWCAWDSNPWPHDGRCRTVHWAKSVDDVWTVEHRYPWVEVIWLFLGTNLSQFKFVLRYIKRLARWSKLMKGTKHTWNMKKINVNMSQIILSKFWWT